MDLSYTREGNTVIIELHGLFEYPDEPKLTRYILNRIDEKPHTIAMDFKNVDSINSAGIAALLSVLKLADEKKVEFVLFNLNQKVQHLLEKVFSQDLVPLLTEDEFRVKYL
ncbi:MAG TPA: anti-sigma factor antagonist [Spirochaetes bacterium]|nr:anti-sigma factor antagonist [Spirochaetota bacterium]